MAVTVRLPAPLRPFAGGAKEFSVEAPTVFDALQAIGSHHPRLQAQFLTRAGTPQPRVAILVNDVDIEDAYGVQTKLHDGDVLRILPRIEGGRSR